MPHHPCLSAKGPCGWIVEIVNLVPVVAAQESWQQGRLCFILFSTTEKGAMATRIAIEGAVQARDAEGRTTRHRYTGSYSTPIRDRLGLLSFNWRATVEGTCCQPEPRTLVLRVSEDLHTPELVRCRIETAIIKHLECEDVHNA
jgi:hypothetical protein